MSDMWYYVQEGQRQGPIEFDAILKLYQNNSLSENDFVWTKGFENWKKIKDIEEFSVSTPEVPEELEVEKEVIWNLTELKTDINIIFVRVGVDRSSAPQEYGPFSLDLMRRLYNENRINAKTQVFIQGMSEWIFLAEMPGFEEVFEQVPPVIEESERRQNQRKPFIARMFIQQNDQVIEGICRDISTGGMQVLVDNYPGKVGDKISINVHPENSDFHFVASGEIVRLLNGNLGFSFRFINLGDDAINAIDSYLKHG